MSVSIVNGYVCYSGCDAAKARTGQDPHPKSDAGQPGETLPTAGGVQNPAVTFGGSLADRNAVPSAGGSQETTATNANPSSNGVDRYV